MAALPRFPFQRCHATSPELLWRWFCPGAGLGSVAGAEQLLLSEDKVNPVPRNSGGAAAALKIGQQRPAQGVF